MATLAASETLSKRLNVEFPKVEFLAIKAFAASNDKTVTQLVREALSDTMRYDAWFRERAKAAMAQVEFVSDDEVALTRKRMRDVQVRAR